MSRLKLCGGVKGMHALFKGDYVEEENESRNKTNGT